MMNLKDWFEYIPVVTLQKFPKRWKAFTERASKLELTGYQKFDAIEGDKCPPPGWWRAGNGAWGCMCSHFHIVQRHLTNGNNGHLLVFEDDCVFSDDFNKRLPEVMKEVGDDWDMLYLGGQHQHLGKGKAYFPWREKGQKEVITAYNLCRTHAVAVSKRFAPEYQKYIISAGEYLKHSHWLHFDHQLGRLHETKKKKILAVQPWICGQAEGLSWTTGRKQRELWWQIKKDQINEHVVQ